MKKSLALSGRAKGPLFRFAIYLTLLTLGATSTRPAPDNWLTSIDQAYLLAQRTRQPILVFIQSPGDPASAHQEEVLTSNPIVDRLSTYVIVRLDSTQSRRAVLDLGVSSVPSLRLLTPAGRVFASQNGFIDTGALANWLTDNRAPAPPSLIDPNVGQNLSDLSNSDPAARERAIRYLSSSRASAPRVVDLLATGNMAARLAAMELLDQWGAPTKDIDPWSPSTILPQRISALRAWAAIASTQPSPTTQAIATTQASDIEIELDSLLSATSEFDARAVRERLLIHGESIIPNISRRLTQVSSDTAVQRLTALRYRLVATDRLAAQWPGGFDRLASVDTSIRRAAIDELAGQAKPEDARLLAEIFTDRDPFLRERSLRLLRAVSGPETNKALIKLLSDPDPNVRAAVLKTLAENPAIELSDDLVAYVAREKDGDLVVHAVHVLQDTPGKISLDCLTSLLSHAQWRVRAEACDALSHKLEDNATSNDAPAAAAVVTALIKCLDDSDGYVVNRAAAALAKSRISTAADSMLAASERHPEIAVEVLKSFENDSTTARAQLPRIRKFAKSDLPPVRAMAITVVCQTAPKLAGEEIKTGLNDTDPNVRHAAALGLDRALELIFPRNGELDPDPGSNNYENRQHVDVQQWTTDFRQGKGRVKWLGALQPQLEQILKDPDPQIRAAAAVALCSIGHEEEAWPILQDAAKSSEGNETAAGALPWLPWEKRTLFFDQLIALKSVQKWRLFQDFTMISDPRAIPQVWDTLTHPQAENMIGQVYQSLEEFYGINRHGEESDQLDAQNPTVTALKGMLAKGNDLQKLVALCLLYDASRPDVAKPAREILHDPTASAALQADALSILLMALPHADGQALAVEATTRPSQRKTAVEYLAVGSSAISRIRDEIYLNRFDSSSSVQMGQIIPILVPPGLKLDSLRDMLKDRDPDVVGYTAYLLVISGDATGIGPLMKSARAHGLNDSDWSPLVYRAITKLDDDSLTPVLEEIYTGYGKNAWEAREFYWTIRAMKGPNVMKLRKKIRDEVGMTQLQ